MHCCVVSSSAAAERTTTRQTARNVAKGLPGAQIFTQSTVRDLHACINIPAFIDNLAETEVVSGSG